MYAAVTAIDYHLPETELGNEQLAALSDRWTADKIHKKTGISRRRIAKPDECASDLAVAAARKLFASGRCDVDKVDFLMLCTQSPDYLLPTTACLLQDRLGLSKRTGALDFNLGCSGYVYGIGMAKGLIETGQARCVLLITAETYSKYIHESDLNVRALFGDAAAATVIEASSGNESKIGPFVYGTDGSGAANLIVKNSAIRKTNDAARLWMNGPEIFSFTLEAVPKLVGQLLERANLTIDQIDLFAFHQANKYMLDHLREKISIPADRFCYTIEDCGNTVSATIPIALAEAHRSGRVKSGDTVMLVGFGVGYSWGATLVRWTGKNH